MGVSEKFEELARDVSSRAADIPCPQSEYRDGLETIISTLQIDIQASREIDPDA